MRKPHLLQSNKGQEIPEEFIFFDVETFPIEISEEEVEHKFRLGVALYWRNRKGECQDTLEWLKFSDPNQFWDWIIEKNLAKRRLVLMAHNIEFDMKVLKGFEALKLRGYKLVKLISEHFVNIWKFRQNKKAILFLDTMNFFNLPLKRLGQDIGLEKLKMPDYQDSDENWFVYCQRDVEIIYQAMKTWLDFIKENNLGCFSPTLASQSFNAFRHRFNKFDIYIHNRKQVIDLERESYHGGRTECFFIGKLPEENYFNLDVNSMYSAVMRQNLYPTKLKAHLKLVSLPVLKRLLNDYCVIARVKLEAKEPGFPHSYIDKLCFPIGQFETVLTSRELSYALSQGYVKECREAAVYEKAPLFIDYVNFFYQKRISYLENANFSFAFISKILLNSLYGKWGQRNEVFKIVAEETDFPDGCFEEWDLDTGEIIKYRAINGTLEKSIGKVEAFHSFPAIAAHITADARFLLWNYIKIAGRENVFYCDTDSLFVNARGLEHLKPYLSNSEMGKLKLKDSTRDLEIWGLKDYRFGQQVKMKGIRPDAEKIADNKFKQWQWEGLRGSLKKARLNQMVLKKITKVLWRDYFKGQILASGIVQPFNLQLL